MSDRPASQVHPPMPAPVFRVGVTGHRPNRLRQVEPVLLAQQIERVLTAVAEAARSEASETLLVLVTSLAEGADRIAAHAAHRIGYTLQVPLPMPANLYEEDFTGEATPEAGATSVAEFRTLLALAEGHTLVLPPPENDLHEPEQRTPCYVAAGEVLLNGCDLLLAVTDDRPSGGPGGAKDIESNAKSRGLPTVRVAAFPGAPITFGNHAQPLHALRSAVHHVLKNKRVLQHQEKLYRCEQWPKRHPAAAYAMLRLVAERRFALPARPHHEAPVPHLRSASLAKYFRWTDTLAVFYGERSRTAALRLQLLATASIIAALMIIALNASRTVPSCLSSLSAHPAGGHEFLTPTLALALSEVGFLAWLVLGVRISRRGAWHDRWLRYRSIAEQLRCVDILAPLGLSSIRFTPRSPSEHPSATALLPWLVRRIEAELGLVNARVTSEYLRAHLRHVEVVLKDQADFHTAAARRYKAAEETFHRGGMFMFYAATALAVAHLAHELFRPAIEAFMEHHHGVELVLTSSAAILPALGAATAAIVAQGEYKRLAERSGSMAASLNGLITHLQSMPQQVSLYAASSVCLNAAEVLSGEVRDWSDMLASRAPGIPI